MPIGQPRILRIMARRTPYGPRYTIVYADRTMSRPVDYPHLLQMIHMEYKSALARKRALDLIETPMP